MTPHPKGPLGGAEIRRVCESCHTNLAESVHVSSKQECVTCHMPRRAVTDIAHAAITDNRIMRSPRPESPQDVNIQPELIAWREPKADIRQRDLGLAYLQVAEKRQFRQMGEIGARVLSATGVVLKDDQVALIGLGTETLEEGNSQAAADLFLQALRVNQLRHMA